MFTANNIENALVKIFGICNIDEMDAMFENYGEEFEDIDPEVLEIIFDENADTVHDFHVLSAVDQALVYCGKTILPRRAVRLLGCGGKVSGNEKISVYHCSELWLMEDMSFVHVRNTAVVAKDDTTGGCVAEYREYVEKITKEEDVFFTPSQLVSALDDMFMKALEEFEATMDEQ